MGGRWGHVSPGADDEGAPNGPLELMTNFGTRGESTPVCRLNGAPGPGLLVKVEWG